LIDNYDKRDYSREVKEHSLTLYCNGMGAEAFASQSFEQRSCSSRLDDDLSVRSATTICANALWTINNDRLPKASY
ncbi:MAG: hypothetical protein AAFO76_16085, partial [Cyanobacteria bacterium J06607_15]